MEALVADETAEWLSDAGSGLDAAERRLLAEMPLHAITSVHGKAGLRERLLIEIADFLCRIRTGSGMRWRWHRGCTRVTGGSANPTSAICSG